MIHDQANRLRQLVRERAAADSPGGNARPALVVVTSGKGGTGTTTIAVNVAVASARSGRPTVLVDADCHGGDAAIICGIQEHYTLADVLAGRRTVRQALQPAPGGVRILPGDWSLQKQHLHSPRGDERLFEQLEALGELAELVVVDAGSNPNGLLPRLAQAAELVLIVTTPETTSIVDAYALIKSLAAGGAPGPIGLLVNQTPNPTVGRSVQARFARACRQLLAMEIRNAGQIPADGRIAAAAEAGTPVMIASAECDAAQQIARLAGNLQSQPLETVN